MYNFATIPPVPIRSALPLWDLSDDERMSLKVRARPKPAQSAPFGGIARPVLAVYVFVASEAVFFGALLVAYIAYRTKSASGPSPSDLEVSRTALFTIALLASSATMILAGRSLRAGAMARVKLWLVASIALAAIFLYGQLTEYRHLYHDHITIDRNLFTSGFFTLTGFHSLHVALGMIAIGVLAWLAFSGGLRPDRRTAFEAITVYWHFVDLVWVVLFSVIYLSTLL